MGKWREYAENLDDCDDYMRQNVAPWVNQKLQQSLPEGCDEAQAQVSQAKVTLQLVQLWCLIKKNYFICIINNSYRYSQG